MPQDPRQRWAELAAQADATVALTDADDRAAAAGAEFEARGLGQSLVGTGVLDLVDAELTDAAAAIDPALDLADPLTVAALALKTGKVDAVVGGATRPTADIVRAGLRIVGVAPQVSVVSSSFYFVLPDGRSILYGDCGVVPDPDADQLADIAVASAGTYADLSGSEPRVALLSYSTKGSAGGANVDKVRAARDRVRQLAPELVVDGELQFDAAWVPEVGARKAPDSAVGGRANVFIFPNLDAGNIAYKITERLGGASAFGPLLQGLNGVLHDLSRGCSTDDIVSVATIAAAQVGARSTTR